MTKNSSVIARARYSLAGVKIALRQERSLRTHVAASLVIFAALAWDGADAFWWAVLILAVVAGWAFEIANAAIETLCDKLHPCRDPMIGQVKDLASAAAFVVNMAIVVLIGIYLISRASLAS